MLKKSAILVCIISMVPAAAGAQEVTTLAQAQPAEEAPATVNLMPRENRTGVVLAANDVQGTREERPKKTHTGLTFKEFCDVHFGEYRWVYWVGAVAAIVAIHVVAAD
ncbi:hypothetical protein [Geomonas oryzae]|uniref:hypothetical protein n=1 Tax=Geomonas oryzae TaxID=2364273 RepID=UPI00100A9902|nr:hypothetical protein [Geomonas oryzae]